MGGLNSPEELCTQAKSYGAKKIVLTDTNGLYGIPRFLECAKKYELTPIIGTEIRRDRRSFILIAKNRKGYEEICHFISIFHMHNLSISESVNWLKGKSGLLILSFDKNILLELKAHNEIYFEMSMGFFTHKDYQWAVENGIFPVANQKIHYLNPSDEDCYKLIRAIDENTTIGEIDVTAYHNNMCFMHFRDEYESYFALYPDALENANQILDEIDSSWFFQGFISPGYNDLPEEICNEKLRMRCVDRIPIRYKGVSEEVLKRVYTRLDYEMKIIAEKRFSSYFLNVKDMTSQCEYTCGRGSSAASIVNYLLEITHVDPIAENLLFDRFMNVDRIDPPDIDVDFPSDQRDDVLDYIFERFKGRAAMVANQNYLRGRSAMREIAKVYGVKEDEISYTLDRLHRLKPNQVWKKIIYYASRIEGVVRHLSVHCGGVVITPTDIRNYGPIEMSKKGYPVLQWEKDQTELAGLIKTDILGNKGLSVIRDVIGQVNEKYQEKIVYSKMEAQQDEKTRRLFITGNTVGVIHFESPRCRTLLAAFGSSDLLTLSIVCSIIRPAAMTQVDEMLRRFKGGRFSYAHPDLEEALGITKGVMVYQEDVMRVTKSLAGFTSQEGNELRKVLAKKHKSKRLAFYKEKFFEGCQNKKISLEEIELLWKDILSFAGYSFCKPHSDSYSLVAYKSAYLKAHYPAEFMAAVITNGGGFYINNIEDYLNEARRMGVVVLPPDINESDYEFTGHDFSVRVGLKQVKFIKTRTLKRIVGERHLGAYLSLEDFLERTQLSLAEARILVKARCFGSVRKEDNSKLSHSEIMWRVYQYFAKKSGKLGYDKSFPILKIKPPEFQKEKLIKWEYETLDGFVTFPSWFLYRDLLKKQFIITGTSLNRYLGKEVILYGQKVTQKRVSTKYKEHMSFITFADDTSMYNTVFFPKVYEEARDLLFLGGSFLIKGKVDKDFDDFQVIVSSIQRIGEI